MVATPSATSRSTGWAVMPRSLSGAQAACDEAVGARLEPGRLAGEQRGGVATGPVRGQQRVRQAGVGEEELPPLVDQVEAGRERRLVLVLVGAEVLVDEVVGRL